MKKNLIAIALGILIVASFIAIGLSFGSLAKNEKENEKFTTQIKQNDELKEKLPKIEDTIVAYAKETEMFNQIKKHIDIEEADLKKEKEALEKIKKELDKDNVAINKKKQSLDNEFSKLEKKRKSLTETEKKLISYENEYGEGYNGWVKRYRTKFEKDKRKYNSDWKQYKTDRNNLNNSKQKYQAEMNSYNKRLEKYNNNCLAFNNENKAFKAEEMKYKRKNEEIQKLKEEKAEIEQKISAFEKENPNIQAKYDEFQQTKSYLIMLIVVFSSLLFALIIALIFVLIFKIKNKSQKPKIRTTRNNEPKLHEYDFSPSTKADELKIEEYEDKQLLNKFDAVLSKIAGLSSTLDDLNARINKIEENKTNYFPAKHNEKTITQPIKNGAFEERLEQLEEKMREIESIFDYKDDEKND